MAMDTVRAKSASLHWELMFTRPRFQTPDLMEQHRLLNHDRRIVRLLSAQRLQLSFGTREIARCHQ